MEVVALSLRVVAVDTVERFSGEIVSHMNDMVSLGLEKTKLCCDCWSCYSGSFGRCMGKSDVVSWFVGV